MDGLIGPPPLDENDKIFSYRGGQVGKIRNIFTNIKQKVHFSCLENVGVSSISIQ